MSWLILVVTKIILLYKRLFGRRNSDDNTPQQQLDVPIDSDHDDTSQQLDAPASYVSTSHIESINSNAPTLSLPHGEYEVFLSFRGPDTRSRITDLLYRFLVHLKIRTFRDDDELRVGEGIWPELVRAINQSKIYVVIFSKSYAHSKWCLKELAEIIEHRRRDKGHIVIPIFYMVDPRDVRHQTGPYEEAFRRHEVEFDERIIQTWKEALKEAGNLKGEHIKSKDEEGAIADLVSNIVWSHLSKNNYVLETDELIGIEDPIEDVVHKLNLDSRRVSSVGIHGIGGIGKTTLAMAVYNKISARFERCSFLENIRETQQQKDGTLALQKKLISNVMRSDSVGSTIIDASEGRRIIRERVSQFKVLIVLDDVDEKFRFDEVLGDLQNFISGSRFIVTSRNVKVLRNLDGDIKCELYEVYGMSPDRSLRLFCKHAFKMDYPPIGFETLSKDIVSTTGGLPLTLKVVGSFLFREEVIVWKEKLEQLRKMPEKEVMERLKISYDALRYEAKQIFLDIACLFIGADREIASYMWSDLDFFPSSSISILTQMSMIKIGSRNEFQMHDQLRDMGREIVREENIEHSWMRSRIWSKDEAMELLLNKMGTDQVKAIRIDDSDFLVLEDEHFSNLLELRYFDGQWTALKGDFGGLLPNLRWLRLQRHFKSVDGHLTNFHMRNLVIFESSDNSQDWSHIKIPYKLKVLNLSHLGHTSKLPEFPDSGSLEMLNLQSFNNVLHNFSYDYVELDIRNLWNLKVLNMRDCKLSKIKGGTFGTMKCLRELDLTEVQCGENLSETLLDIGALPVLEILRTVQTSMILGRICGVEVLAGIKLPTSLKVLTTSSAVANLSELLELGELEVDRCESRFVFPTTTASPSWWKSSKLESLTVRSAPNVVMVPNITLLPSRLVSLCILLTPLEWLPSLENLENLIELHIQLCTGFREVRGLGRLKSLQKLLISSAHSLTRLDGLGTLMSSPSPSNCKLTMLHITDCPLLSAMLDDCGAELPVIHSLQNLYIDECPLLDGASIPRLSKLPGLTSVLIGGITMRSDGDGSRTGSSSALLEGLGDLQELAELRLFTLPTVRRLPSLSKLRQLRRLILCALPRLQEIQGLEGLESLVEVHISECWSLQRFPVENLPSGVEKIVLDLRGCSNFNSDLSSLTDDHHHRRKVTIRWPDEPAPPYDDDNMSGCDDD